MFETKAKYNPPTPTSPTFKKTHSKHIRFGQLFGSAFVALKRWKSWPSHLSHLVPRMDVSLPRRALSVRPPAPRCHVVPHRATAQWPCLQVLWVVSWQWVESITVLGRCCLAVHDFDSFYWATSLICQQTASVHSRFIHSNNIVPTNEPQLT